jgi:nitronate monooxygenase
MSSSATSKASEDQIEVNQISPTGYPMRMLSNSPAIGDGIRPNCEAYGYLLDSTGNCSYITAYNREVAANPGVKKISVGTRPVCARRCATSIAGPAVTTPTASRIPRPRLPDGSYQLLSAEHIFHDYQFSTDGKIRVPE